MNRPVEPFRIIGDIYYVGASDVAVYLIPTPEGHILIDGGFEETVPLIRKSFDTLGFALSDVRILLHSHAHLDHVGGLRRLQELSGAKIFASTLDAPALERGGLGDPLLGDEAPFPAVKVDRRLRDGDRVELGGVVLTARITAGHTEGCTSWVTMVEEAGRSYRVVSIGSLTVLPGMRLSDRPTYPGIADDYTRSFAILEELSADVFLASHASFFGMKDKRARLEAGERPNPFIDPEGYRAFVARSRRKFEQTLAGEKGAGEPGLP